MKQLGLPIALDAKVLLSNFIGKKNQQIINFLNQAITQKDSCIIYVVGGPATGKTHLLQGCTFVALEKKQEVLYVDIQQELPDGVLNNIETTDCVCIDNVDYLNTKQQQALFHLYNQVQKAHTTLIVSSCCLPNELNVLQDLKTRLSLAFLFKLEPLSDDEKIRVVKRRMRDKNIKIKDKVYNYLFKHYSRNLTDIFKVIDQLDKLSLQQKHDISIPFVKQILASV